MKLVYKKNKQFNGPVLLYKRMKEGIMDACETISNMLESMAHLIAKDSACSLLWGEVTMPKCLKDELQKKISPYCYGSSNDVCGGTSC